MSIKNLPKLVVFDLDGTLWIPEMYELWGGGAPFKLNEKNGNVFDRNGTEVKLMGISRQILKELNQDEKWKNTQVAISSKTDEPIWAEECLQKIRIDKGLNMKSVFKYEQISKNSKDQHFRALKKQTGIEFQDMIFFDNQSDNISIVSKLGVHSVLCPNGMEEKIWKDGINSFQNKI